MKNVGCDMDCVYCSTYEGCDYDWKETVDEREETENEEEPSA